MHRGVGDGNADCIGRSAHSRLWCRSLVLSWRHMLMKTSLSGVRGPAQKSRLPYACGCSLVNVRQVAKIVGVGNGTGRDSRNGAVASAAAFGVVRRYTPIAKPTDQAAIAASLIVILHVIGLRAPRRPSAWLSSDECGEANGLTSYYQETLIRQTA
jgi:hypothetical protein